MLSGMQSHLFVGVKTGTLGGYVYTCLMPSQTND